MTAHSIATVFSHAVAAASFVALVAAFDFTAQLSAGIAASLGIAVRLLAVRYDWRTRPLYWEYWQL